MRTVRLFITALLATGVCKAQEIPFANGAALIKAMHKRYFKAPCMSYTFSQKNQHYSNDTVIGESEWHEAVEFPDKFRIRYGKKEAGNYVLFRNDSVYNYRKFEISRIRIDSNSLLLLLGGMYYRTIGDVLGRLNMAGFDTSQVSMNIWNNAKVYVMGAKPGDLNSNQFWVDPESFRIVRVIERINPKDMMDMRFESHQPMCRGYVENKVSFRRNGMLEQVEEYYDIKETSGFPD